MKKGTIITVTIFIILALILKSILSYSDGKTVAATPSVRVPKIVQTQLVEKTYFQEQVHVTGRVAADKEVTVSTQ